MTFWARLTWQVPDPLAFAADLARQIGAVVEPGGLVPGAFTLDLGTAMVELRPWQPEAPGDGPRPAGRLMFEPVPGGDEPPAGMGTPPAGRGAAVAETAAGQPMLAGVGWATVDLDRAEAELDPWLGVRDVVRPADGVEPHLGARARCRGAGGLPAGVFVMLEPSTEGRLAASLARFGEGPCTLYLEPAEGLAAWRRAASARGILTSAVRSGPLGPSSLLIARRAAGPHLVIVDHPRSSPMAPASTIGA